MMSVVDLLPCLSVVQVRVLPHGIPHAPVYFLVFWAASFVSLALALVGLSLLSAMIESDFELMSLKKEAVLAMIASAIEGVGVWLLAAYVPAAAARGILLPMVIVVLLYQVAHYDTWSKVDGLMLIVFQGVIVLAGVAFILGHILFGIGILVVLGVFLVLFAALARGLS